jgi:hypothetical protein
MKMLFTGGPLCPIGPKSHSYRGRVAYICLPLANLGPLLRAIPPKAHSYRGPFRTEHLPVTGVTDADTGSSQNVLDNLATPSTILPLHEV